MKNRTPLGHRLVVLPARTIPGRGGLRRHKPVPSPAEQRAIALIRRDRRFAAHS